MVSDSSRAPPHAGSLSSVGIAPRRRRAIDAPALAKADLGIAMSAAGTDTAIELLTSLASTAALARSPRPFASPFTRRMCSGRSSARTGGEADPLRAHAHRYGFAVDRNARRHGRPPRRDGRWPAPLAPTPPRPSRRISRAEPGYGFRPMTPIGRRQFCAEVGAGLVGLSAALMAGCASTASDTGASPSNSTAAGGMLAGLAFEVRRDPG